MPTLVVRANVTHVSPMPDLVTPAAGRDQWLRCAAACLANDSIDRNLWLSLAADCLYPGLSVFCGTTRRARARSSVQEEKEKEARAHGVACLLDPGSNAHLTNVRGVLKPGSVVSCNVEVQGLNGEGQRLFAKEKGTYEYKMSENDNVDLDGMLFVPDSVIGSTVNEPMVLVSSGRMAKACDVGTHFVAGGDRVEFIRDGHVVGGFDTSADCGLYIDRREQTDEARERQRLVALCASVLFGWSENVKEENNVDEEKHENEKKGVEQDNERKESKNEESMKTYEEKKKEKKERRKKAKENKRDNEVKKQADKETDNKADKKAKPQISKREREVLLRKLHARLHFGKTRMTLDALKDAYGIDFDDACSVPCDACAWAKAKHAPVSKTSTRKAARVGARLHYDVFTAGARSDSGCKYLLVVVDEKSDHVWVFGLKRKSETSDVMRALILQA